MTISSSRSSSAVMDRPAGHAANAAAVSCPNCGARVERAARWQHQQDLAIIWLYPDPARLGAVRVRRHCARCQPHAQVAAIECPLCGDGPMVAGELVDFVPPEGPTGPVRSWLLSQGWRGHEEHELVCGNHR